MSSLEGPTKAFREFFMMCYHHPKSVTIGIENVTSLQKVTHGNIVSKFTFLSTVIKFLMPQALCLGHQKNCAQLKM